MNTSVRTYITALLAMSALVTSAETSVKAKADSVTLTMGDRANVNVEVITDRPAGRLVGLPKPEEDYHGMELVNQSADTADLGNGRTQITHHLTFQAFDPAPVVTLPPFRYVTGTDTFLSDIVTFKVLPVELSPELGDINNPDSLTIHPSESFIAVKSKWYDYIPDWSIWVLIGLAVAALAIVLYLLYKKNGPAIFTPRKPIPPYELAMRRLAAIRSKGLIEQGRTKEYYTELTDTLRSYLEGRFGIYAMEMTSKQILKKLRENQDTKLSADQIEQTLELSDFVKFAGMKPLPDDNVKTFNTIYDFVESTKPAPLPEEADKDNRKEKK